MKGGGGSNSLKVDGGTFMDVLDIPYNLDIFGLLVYIYTPSLDTVCLLLYDSVTLSHSRMSI